MSKACTAFRDLVWATIRSEVMGLVHSPTCLVCAIETVPSWPELAALALWGVVVTGGGAAGALGESRALLCLQRRKRKLAPHDFWDTEGGGFGMASAPGVACAASNPGGYQSY